MSYKEMADSVTAQALPAILAECERRMPMEQTFDRGLANRGKNGTNNCKGRLSEYQFRAIENFRRRIYDAWSVLRATGII